MKKTEEKKLFKQIKESIGEQYQKTDDVLIQECLDWIKISIKAKEELEKSVGEGDSIRDLWQLLTTIAMSSKQTQSLFTKLGITPQERNKMKVLVQDNDVDLNELLK